MDSNVVLWTGATHAQFFAAGFNDRALRVATACGFAEATRFRRADGVEFAILVRGAHAAGDGKDRL
jgi:hypothetical protein